jgi:ankyrin repeat protein
MRFSVIFLMIFSLFLALSVPVVADEIHTACKNGDLEKVRALIGAKPSIVNRMDAEGLTPLHRAAGHGHREIVLLLIEKGADVKARTYNTWCLPMHLAAQDGHFDIVQIFLDRKVPVNIIDKFGCTALHWAAGGIVAGDGLRKTVVILLKAGADRDLSNSSGLTALELAEIRKNDNVAAELRRK